MGSMFDDEFAVFAASPIVDQFAAADLTTYSAKAAGSSDVEVRAILGAVKSVWVDAADGTVTKETQRNYKILADPESRYGGVTSPKLTDEVTIGDDVWAVVDIETSTATFHELVIKRLGKGQQSRKMR